MTSDYKVLGQSNPTAANLTDCYTVPASIQAVVSSVIITNRSGTPTSFRISVAPAGVADSDEQYIAYDADISGNDVVDFTIGMTLDATDVVRVYATDATLSFNVYGEEIGGSGGGGGFAIGSSFLEATSPDVSGQTTGAALTLPLTLDTSAGSDLAIDGGDSTKLNVVTTGWYSIMFPFEAFADVGGTGLSNIEQDILLNGALEWFWYIASSPTSTLNASGNVLAIPAYAFTAGDFLQFKVNVGTVDNSNWAADLLSVQVVRFA